MLVFPRIVLKNCKYHETVIQITPNLTLWGMDKTNERKMAIRMFLNMLPNMVLNWLWGEGGVPPGPLDLLMWASMA